MKQQLQENSAESICYIDYQILKWYNSLLRKMLTHIWQNFPKKCYFQIISHVQWWTKKFHPILHSTHQECMVFARIGDGPCHYHWNEIYAGVIQHFLPQWHSVFSCPLKCQTATACTIVHTSRCTLVNFKKAGHVESVLFLSSNKKQFFLLYSNLLVNDYFTLFRHVK